MGAVYFSSARLRRQRVGDDPVAELAREIAAGRDHPVFGLWPVGLADDLRRAVVDEDIRKVDVWTARYRLARVDFATDPVDPFFNLNSPEDMARAEALFAAAAPS